MIAFREYLRRDGLLRGSERPEPRGLCRDRPPCGRRLGDDARVLILDPLGKEQSLEATNA